MRKNPVSDVGMVVLTNKSLIRSDDPEWFLVAPKDRKYSNGSRSHKATEAGYWKATEAGYWKATAKDRLMKSKGEKK